jgi:hypothetical protein
MSRTLADRQLSGRVRDWAREQGLTVSDSGRIAKAVWDAARGAGVVDEAAGLDSAAGDEPESGPDWDGAAGQLGGGDELGGLEDDLAAEAAAAAPAAPAPPAPPPPPADLDAARAQVRGEAPATGRPRMPKWAAGGGPRTPPPRQAGRRAADVRITKAVTDDITGKLALLLAGPVSVWAAVDPICGGAAADSLDPAVRAAVPLICLSPEAVRWFQKTSNVMLVLELVLALRPVAEAAYHHHVAHDVAVLADGRIVHATRGQDGQLHWPAPGGTGAAAGGADWSAYTTQPAGHIPPVHATA